MLTQREAAKRIDELLQERELLLGEAEQLARKHKLDFSMNDANGSRLYFDGSGEYYGNNDDQPTGWDHSQC